jgi:DNA-directed RNA polymerase subunit M/transcription elongation factor TFIIS
MARELGLEQLKKHTKDGVFFDQQIHDYTIEYMLINSLDDAYYDNIYFCKLQELIKAFVEGNLSKRLKEDKTLKENIIKLPPCKLIPKVWEESIYKRNLIKDKQDNLATSDIYECPMCSKRKCIVTQAQVRSADEPMTTFFKCVECGHSMSFE